MGRETRPRVSNCCLTLRPPESGRRAVPFPRWGSQFNFVSFLLLTCSHTACPQPACFRSLASFLPSALRRAVSQAPAFAHFPSLCALSSTCAKCYVSATNSTLQAMATVAGAAVQSRGGQQGARDKRTSWGLESGPPS